MRDQDRQLAGMCQSWSKAALSAEKWLQDNRKLVGAECDMLRKDMRSAARSFRKRLRSEPGRQELPYLRPGQRPERRTQRRLLRQSRGLYP